MCSPIRLTLPGGERLDARPLASGRVLDGWRSGASARSILGSEGVRGAACGEGVPGGVGARAGRDRGRGAAVRADHGPALGLAHDRAAAGDPVGRRAPAGRAPALGVAISRFATEPALGEPARGARRRQPASRSSGWPRRASGGCSRSPRARAAGPAGPDTQTGSRTCRWLSWLTSGATTPGGPVRPGVRARRRPPRPGRDEAVHELLREPAVDLGGVARRALAPVRARVVDVHVEPVLVAGVADVAELRAEVTAVRAAEVADRHARRVADAPRGTRAPRAARTRTSRSVPKRRQARLGERRSTGSQVKKCGALGGQPHAPLEPTGRRAADRDGAAATRRVRARPGRRGRGSGRRRRGP